MKSLTIAKLVKKTLFYQKSCTVCLTSYCTNTSPNKRKNIEDFFFDQKVQTILKKITGLDYEKVFRRRKQKVSYYKYEFVTEKKLKELQDKALSNALEMLQMPPVVEIRKPIAEVLTKDPELQGYINHKLVFIDTSPDVFSKDRIITVRETDGTLRKASWEERFRMNQILFPLPGRSLEMPKLFESPQLDKLLDEESYEFVLDSACVQFDPDDPEYHRVTSATYEHIRQKKKFHLLRSTRHFGPMAFYFTYNKNTETLLVDMIERQLISDAADTIKLLHIMHPELISRNVDVASDIEVVQDYIKSNSSMQKADLELAIQTFLEIQSSESESKQEVSV